MTTRDNRGFWLALRGMLSGIGVKTSDAARVEEELQGLAAPPAALEVRTTDEAAMYDSKSFKDAVDRAVRDSLKRMKDEDEKEEEERKAKEKAAKDAASAKEREEVQEMEAEDTLLEAEDPGTVINLGKVWNGKSGDAAMTEIRARAQVMAPELTMPTRDACKGTRGATLSNFLRSVLKAVQTKDASAVDPFLLGRKIDDLRGTALMGAFNAVHEFARIKNNAASRAVATAGLRTSDGGGARKPFTTADYAAALAEGRKKAAG